MQSGIIIFFMEELFDEMHNELSLVPQKSGHVSCVAKKEEGKAQVQPHLFVTFALKGQKNFQWYPSENVCRFRILLICLFGSDEPY